MDADVIARKLIQLNGDCSLEFDIRCVDCPIKSECSRDLGERVTAARVYLDGRSGGCSNSDKHLCRCALDVLMRDGCKCGGK